MIIRFIQAYDVPLVVAGTPFRRSTRDDDQFWQIPSNKSVDPVGAARYLDRVVDNALAVSRERDVPVIDTRRFMSMRGPNHRYFYDLLHLNNEGGPVYGRELAEHLSVMGIFD